MTRGGRRSDIDQGHVAVDVDDNEYDYDYDYGLEEGEEVGEVIDEVVGRVGVEAGRAEDAPGDAAGDHAGGAAGEDVALGVADHEAVAWVAVEGARGGEQEIGRRFVRNAVG